MTRPAIYALDTIYEGLLREVESESSKNSFSPLMFSLKTTPPTLFQLDPRMREPGAGPRFSPHTVLVLLTVALVIEVVVLCLWGRTIVAALQNFFSNSVRSNSLQVVTLAAWIWILRDKIASSWIVNRAVSAWERFVFGQ
ncbi:MAG: hypothetical protein P4M13_10550 [Alphaproteobacteria bacterium]|nr:hypothetical protein [Alphaproteobacteria bacterium]